MPSTDIDGSAVVILNLAEAGAVLSVLHHLGVSPTTPALAENIRRKIQAALEYKSPLPKRCDDYDPYPHQPFRS